MAILYCHGESRLPPGDKATFMGRDHCAVSGAASMNGMRLANVPSYSGYAGTWCRCWLLSSFLLPWSSFA